MGVSTNASVADAAAAALPLPTMAATTTTTPTTVGSNRNKTTLTHLTQQLRQTHQHDNNNSFYLNGFDLGGNLYLQSHDFMADYLAFRQAVRQNKTIQRLYVTIPIMNMNTSTDNNNNINKNSILSEMIPLLDAIGTLPNLSEIYWNSTATATTTTLTSGSDTATATDAAAATNGLRHDLAVLLRVLNKASATNANSSNASSNNLRVLDIETNVPTTRDDLRQLTQGIRAACGDCSLEKVQLRGFGGSGRSGDIHDIKTLLQDSHDEQEQDQETKDDIDKDNEYSVENHPLSLLTADLAHMGSLQTLCLDPSLASKQQLDDTSLLNALLLPPMNASCLFSLLQNLPHLQHLQLQSIRFDSWGCAALVQYLSNNHCNNSSNKKKMTITILDLSRCSFPPRVMHGNDSIYTNCNETSLLESLSSSSEHSTLQQLVLQDVVITDVHQLYKSAAIGLSHNKTLQRFVLEPAVNNKDAAAVVSAETVHALFAAVQTSAVTQLHLPSLPKLVQDASALVVDLNTLLLHDQESLVQELVLDIGHVSSRVTANELQALSVNHTLCQWDTSVSASSSSYYKDWTCRKNIWLRLNQLGRKRVVLLQQQECIVKEDNKIQQQQHVVAAVVEMLCQVREDVDCSFTLLTEFPSVCNRQVHQDLSSLSSSPVTTTAAEQAACSKQQPVVDDGKSVSARSTATTVGSTTVVISVVPLEETAAVASNASSAAARAKTTTPRDAGATSTVTRVTLTAVPSAATAKQKQESASSSANLYNDVAFLVEEATDFLTCAGLDSVPEQQQKHVSVKKATTTTSPTTAQGHYRTYFSSPRDAREEIIANSQTTTTATVGLEQDSAIASDKGHVSYMEKNHETTMSTTETHLLLFAATKTTTMTTTGSVLAACAAAGEEKKTNDVDIGSNSRRRPSSNTTDLDPVFGAGTRHWTNSVSISNDSTYQDHESVPLSEPVSVASCLDGSNKTRDNNKDKPSILPVCMTGAEATEKAHIAVSSIQELSTSNNDGPVLDPPNTKADAGGSTQQDSVSHDLAKSRIGAAVVSPRDCLGSGLGKSPTAACVGRLGLLKSSNCHHRGSPALAAAGNSLLASVDSAMSACLTDTLIDTISDAAMNTCQSGEQMVSGDNRRRKGSVSTRSMNPELARSGVINTYQAGEQMVSGDSHPRKGSLSTRRVNQGRDRFGREASGGVRGGVGKSSIVTEAGLGLLTSHCVSDCLSDTFADTLSDLAMSTCQAGEDMVTSDDSHRREGPVSTINMPAYAGGLRSCGVRGELELTRWGVGVDSRDATSTREVGETTHSVEKIMMRMLAESVSVSDALSDIAYGGCELGEQFVLTATTSCRGNEAIPRPEIATNSVKGPGQSPSFLWGLSEEARRRVAQQKMLCNKSPIHDAKISASPQNQELLEELQVMQSAVSNVECHEDMHSVSTISEGNDHNYQEIPVAATVIDVEQPVISNKSGTSVDESELLNLLSALSHVGSSPQETTIVASVMEPKEARTDCSVVVNPTQKDPKEEAIVINKPVSPPRGSVKRVVAQWEVRTPPASPICNRTASLSPVSHPSRKSNPGRWLEIDKNSEEGTATCTTASVTSSGPQGISLGDEDVSTFASTVRFVNAMDLTEQSSQKPMLVEKQAAQRPPLPPTFGGTCSRALERDE